MAVSAGGFLMICNCKSSMKDKVLDAFIVWGGERHCSLQVKALGSLCRIILMFVKH